MKISIKLCSFVLIILILSIFTFGQKKVEERAPLSGLPAEQQADLINRINLFTEAQKNNQWDKIADLIGEYRNIALKEKYTDKQKECVIEQMKFSPIVSYTITGAMTTTAVYNYPKENWWYFLQGIAEIKTDSGIITQQKKLGVYRNNQQWFIYPQRNIYEWFEKNHRKDTSPEVLNSFLQVVKQPDSPLEISDISVKMNSKDYSWRDYTFKVRNTSQKTIDYFLYEVEEGRSNNNSKKIMPNETVSFDSSDQHFSPYDNFYCDGEKVRKIYITFVRFEDGSEWRINKKLRDEIN